MIYKVIRTPQKVRIITHNRKIYVNRQSHKRKRRKNIFSSVNYSNIYRAINSINTYVECNHGKYTEIKTGRPRETLFITFTFKENISELKTANKLFSQFNRRLYDRLRTGFYQTDRISPKYLAVPEFQQRGAVHYHVLYFNLPFIKNIYDEFKELWSHGWVIFRTVKEFNPTKYLVKDMTKHFSLGTGSKRYFVSRGLFKPSIEIFDHPPKISETKLLSYKEKEYINFTVSTEVYSVDN